MIVTLLCSHLVWRRNQIVSIIWFRGNDWEICFNQGVRRKARLLDNSVISSFICVLNFKLESGKRFSYTIFPDSLPHQQKRRLRVRLKIEQAKLFLK